MKRVEIIANKSVIEDILEAMDVVVPEIHYTLFPDLQGRGRQGIRRGDDVWPEQNGMVLVFCTDDEAELIRAAVHKLKEHFPREGIKVFISCVECV